ncbi:FAD binding domain-containing protein [Solirubrobacter deserti]|uniref:FAD binding domain-containing protein n=1 Tax=Solirubrobacter deserti TaxID=2282478 RepID=UPI0022CD35D5|nr:FAD binding domain-containing protein [Solirubrobacter deserti]
MKPAPFEYVAVDSWDAALEALTDGARVLAGGQSLVPLLNLRLVRPARLVDVTPIVGLIRRTDGVLRIDATVRQATLERSRIVAAHWPLLAQAVRHVGHPATRSRGTVGGSVAHADPRAELVCALTALDARYETMARTLVERTVRDTVSATRTGPPTLGPGELLTGIVIPPLPPGAKTAFAEHARTHGSFAEAAAAVVLAEEHAAIAILGAGRATAAERALLDGASAAEAAALAADLVDGDHPRALVTELTRRALVEAGRA